MKSKLFIGTAIFAVLAQPVLAANVKEVSFSAQIRPILNDYCLSCHQPGGKGYEKSGLDMRTYDSLIKGTRFGAVIKPGDSFASTLIMLVEGRADPSIKMPYGMNGSLSRDKIDLLKRWIDQGAKNN